MQAAKALLVSTYAARREGAGEGHMAVSRDILACHTAGGPIEAVQLLAGLELSRSIALKVADLARLSLVKALAPA